MNPLIAFTLIFGSVWLMYEDVMGQDKYLTDIAKAIGGEESDINFPQILDHGGFIAVFLIVILIVSAISEKLAIGLLVLLLISMVMLNFEKIPFIGGNS